MSTQPEYNAPVHSKFLLPKVWTTAKAEIFEFPPNAQFADKQAPN